MTGENPCATKFRDRIPNIANRSKGPTISFICDENPEYLVVQYFVAIYAGGPERPNTSCCDAAAIYAI